MELITLLSLFSPVFNHVLLVRNLITDRRSNSKQLHQTVIDKKYVFFVKYDVLNLYSSVSKVWNWNVCGLSNWVRNFTKIS